MEIKNNTIQIKKNKTGSLNSNSTKESESKMKITNKNTLDTKNYNNFLGVFGVHPNNAKYIKKKKKEVKKECKTPKKNTFKNEENTKVRRRSCITPLKIKNFSFLQNLETEKKEKIISNNLDIKENKIKEQNKNLKNEKPQAEITNKKLLKRASRIYELNFYDPFKENLIILDGEGGSYDVEFERKDFEIKISVNETIFKSFNDIHFTSNYFTFPQYSIFEVKYNQDTKITTIILKDYRSFKFQTKDDSFFKKINFSPEARIEFFKYSYFYSANQNHKNIKYPINGWTLYNPIKEFERQKVPYGMEYFRLSQKNMKYKLCDTYPSMLILPAHFDDSSLVKIASCRTKNRFPVLTYVYTHPKTNNMIIQTFLYRSSQINTGFIFNKKVNYEIEYINTIGNIGKYNNGFIFFDCRPYLNAKANSLKGAGVDDISQYSNCKELIFGCIENIHAVRKSLKKALEKTNYANSSIKSGKLSFNTTNNNLKKFLTKFEETKWLEYLSDIICGANLVVNKLLSKINVICHCSDGWDRTSQVCSLVQIILDPYFRTFEGFAVLIEKDWVSFGHQFALRNGCDCRSDKKKEKSPIFIQFLHTVYQIMVQYPNAFEFSENMLIYLSDEIYSNKFGTFLFNSEKDIIENVGKDITVSIWSEIMLNKTRFINPFYIYIKEPLIVKGEVQYLVIWKEFFYKYVKIGVSEESNMNCIDYVENKIFNQKNNIIQLIKVIKKNGLEKEIIDNELFQMYKDCLDS